VGVISNSNLTRGRWRGLAFRVEGTSSPQPLHIMLEIRSRKQLHPGAGGALNPGASVERRDMEQRLRIKPHPTMAKAA